MTRIISGHKLANLLFQTSTNSSSGLKKSKTMPTKITPKEAMRIVEIADALIQVFDISEMSNKEYYEAVATEYNNLYAQ